ncbi:MAG: prolipoprotein diacylglyceryl transferase [Candidatus Moranbacteria bacterium]|nr:prolipoprotein diacylglyceryl transferase [Candidatus Moranbacteria bacterium]
MDNFLHSYQHLPYHINPTIFKFGIFSLGWYSLMYLVAFLTVYLLLAYRLKKGEWDKGQKYDLEMISDFLLIVFVGLLIGGRIGYVLFYNFQYYAANPMAIISPFDPATGALVGIYGMSFHGGLLGGLLAAFIFIRKKKLDFWKFSDFVIPAVPAGYFFGRIGNFLNGELWGRATTKIWGMYFPGDTEGLLRHPSQIYEALSEGLILFLILWFLRNNPKTKGKLFGIFLAGYGAMRIASEFFRDPDPQIGYVFRYFTLGQLLSVPMIALGIILVFQKRKSVV